MDQLLIMDISLISISKLEAKTSHQFMIYYNRLYNSDEAIYNKRFSFLEVSEMKVGFASLYKWN